MVRIEHLEEADVGLLREARMDFQLRTEAVYRCAVDVLDAQHAMGIAHGYRGQFDALAIHLYLIGQGFALGLERYLGRGQARRTHVHRDLASGRIFSSMMPPLVSTRMLFFTVRRLS